MILVDNSQALTHSQHKMGWSRGLRTSALCLFLLLGYAIETKAAVSPVVGGPVGTDFKDAVAIDQRLTALNVRADGWVDAIQGVNALSELPSHGGEGGHLNQVVWPVDEYLVRVYGKYGQTYIGQISFVTSKGRVLGPYGLGANKTNTLSFDYSVPIGNAIIGFSGRASNYLDALGVIYGPAPIMPTSLKGVKPPSVPGLTYSDPARSDIVTPIVINPAAAIALGKALFWDQQVGSDGQACASCHFHAGADSRLKNQINPGLARITKPTSDSWVLSQNPNSASSSYTFNNTKSGAVKSGPNYTLKPTDFPFDPHSDDVVGSAGTFAGVFQKEGDDFDQCVRNPDIVYHVNHVGTRKTEPRNSPSVINAIFNQRNFWDGRANNVFNGSSPFGLRDKTAGVYVNVDNLLSKRPLKLINAALASQAVGPALSDFEMSCATRKFADIGRKLLTKKPLALQVIDPEDSVLKNLPLLVGAHATYADLVKKAFNSAYWSVNCHGGCGKPSGAKAVAYNQMEANFSMFFGLALQLYQETLITDDSKFDRAQAGTATLTASEQEGYQLFLNKGKCVACHNGPVFSSAALEINKRQSANLQSIERMPMRDGGLAIYDVGFYNIGLVPNDYDIGIGGVDPWNNPLSFAKQAVNKILIDPLSVDPCQFAVPFAPNCAVIPPKLQAERLAVMGAFKVPGLRNVALTGPYMHNGGMATLEQVVGFYNRGGNFDNRGKHPAIQPLGLTTAEQASLVAFLTSLTDERVALEQAPFDHPQLNIPHGHPGDQNAVSTGNPLEAKLATEEFMTLTAVGSAGRARSIGSFEEILNRGPQRKIVHAVDSWSANRLDIVGIGIDNQLYHKAWTGNWYPSLTAWEPMGGSFTSAPTVVSWGENRLDIFAVGTDNQMWHKAWNGKSWNPATDAWEPLGGNFSSAPVAVSWDENRLDVFALGSDKQLWHKAWSGENWNPASNTWEPLGGNFASPPAVVSWGKNRLDIFGVGSDKQMWHKAWAGTDWNPAESSWEPLGGQFNSTPSVVSWGAKRLDIFALGSENQMLHKWWNGTSWGPAASTWESLGGVFNSTPVAAAWGAKRLDVFGLGADKQLWHKAWNGSAWEPSFTDWESLGGSFNTAPTVTARVNNRLDLFSVGSDNQMWHKAWNGSFWVPSVNGWEPLGGVFNMPTRVH